jgi:hypothetical protein
MAYPTIDPLLEWAMRACPPDTVAIETGTWPLPCVWITVCCPHAQTAGVLERGSPRADRRAMERLLVERHRREQRCSCAGPAETVSA